MEINEGEQTNIKKNRFKRVIGSRITQHWLGCCMNRTKRMS